MSDHVHSADALPRPQAVGRIMLDGRERAFERVGLYGSPGGIREFAAIPRRSPRSRS